MPFLQIVLNLPFFLVGFGAKILFFASKGFGREYLAGIKKRLSDQPQKQKSQIFHEESSALYTAPV